MEEWYGSKMVDGGSLLVAVWWRDKEDRAQGADSITVTGPTSKVCALFGR